MSTEPQPHIIEVFNKVVAELPEEHRGPAREAIELFLRSPEGISQIFRKDGFGYHVRSQRHDFLPEAAGKSRVLATILVTVAESRATVEMP